MANPCAALLSATPTIYPATVVALGVYYLPQYQQEISRNDIFGPPPEIQPRSLVVAAQTKDSRDMGEPARNVRTSVKVSNVMVVRASLLVVRVTSLSFNIASMYWPSLVGLEH
ncbi:hypothetical protein ACFE04_008851 [Oxalis oulophora]